MNYQQLKKQYQSLRILYLCYLILAACALALYFVDTRFALAMIFICLVAHLIFLRPASKRYECAYNHFGIQNTLVRHLSDVFPKSDATLDPETLRATRLVAANTTKGSILCCEGATGKHRRCTVAVCDATFTHTFLIQGKKHHEFVTGAWVTVSLPKDTMLDWRIQAKRVMMEPSHQVMKSRERENVVPDALLPDWIRQGGFTVLRPQGTPDLPHATVLKRIESLCSSTKHPIAVAILGAQLHVFVVNRVLGQKVDIREAPKETLLSIDRFPELSHILKLSEACENLASYQTI